MDSAKWLKTMVREHEGALLRYVSRYVDRATAAEIVQESFLRLWKEDMQELQGREKAWLFCVSRNMALDQLKRKGQLGKDAESFDETSVSEANAPAMASSRTPEEDLDRRQQLAALQQALSQLAAKEEEVVRLKFLDGFSYKEISAITGLSVSHVGVLIHQAMKFLRSSASASMLGTEVAVSSAAASKGGRP